MRLSERILIILVIFTSKKCSNVLLADDVREVFAEKPIKSNLYSRKKINVISQKCYSTRLVEHYIARKQVKFMYCNNIVLIISSMNVKF